MKKDEEGGGSLQVKHGGTDHASKFGVRPQHVLFLHHRAIRVTLRSSSAGGRAFIRREGGEQALLDPHGLPPARPHAGLFGAPPAHVQRTAGVQGQRQGQRQGQKE